VTKVLVLGCSHAEVPLVRAAQARGHFVGVLGSSAPGLASRVANTHHFMDYSNVEGVRAVVDDNEYRAVVAGCNDFAAFTRAGLGSLGLNKEVDSYSQTSQLHHKDRFRGLCVKLGVPAPSARLVTSLREIPGAVAALGLPVIVKPTDLTGGKGIRVCWSEIETVDAVSTALERSKRTSIVIEEFIVGQLRSACYWLHANQPTLLIDADEFMYRNPFLVSAAITPSSVSADVLMRLSANVESLARSLKLADGLFHVQYITDDSNYWVIEVCRRPPGDLYLDLPSRLSSASVSEMLIDHSCGDPIEIRQRLEPITPVLRICLMPPSSGAITHWELSDSIKTKVTSYTALASPPLEVSDHLTTKLGIAFVTSPRREVLEGFATQPETAIRVFY